MCLSKKEKIEIKEVFEKLNINSEISKAYKIA